MSKHRTRGTKWNRLLSGVLCLALMLGLLPPAGLVQTAEAAGWMDAYGEQMVEWGIMSPSSDLRLGDQITRAEFVAMCNRAFGYKKLGGTPFVDVPYSAWYAEDIDIAYNAGYFTGTSPTTASPERPLTREEAAVAVARNLLLEEAVGESMGFTDSRDLHEWSRGIISTAVAEGVITGFPDGSFRPANNITRGEVSVLLVRLLGTPISKEGSYTLGEVYGNVVVSSSNVTLRNTTIAGNLYITGGVDLGNILLENVTVLGKIVVSGGGESHEGQSSVVMRNVEADELLVDSLVDQFVTISAYGLTDIPLTTVRTDTYLEDACEGAYGLGYIELAGEAGAELQLAGNIKEVKDLTPFSDLRLVQGTAQKITIDEYAANSQVRLSEGTLVDEMNLDVATLVTGKGDIRHLIIGASDCEVEMLPEEVTIRPGLTATIAGEVMGDLDAAELAEEPRLLAGYPAVKNIAPTTAEGQYAGNKPGTIYWAVSEMVDGDVSVEDLLSNPVYGGNIFANQAGSISASSKNVYVQPIINLEPDVSYYVSAVLVDGRGNISPRKVTSFTTPDNTVPAFTTGYPYMSKVTCDIAQVTAMANKSCLLYYVLVNKGAAAPTTRQLKSGSVGGNLGYGSVTMTKNVPISIQVNRSRLQEKTDYDLYLWLTDINGAQSMAAPVLLSFTTPDETAPVVTAPYQSGYGTVTADVTFVMNEAGTFYWAVVPEGNTSFIPLGATAEETLQILSNMRNKIKVESGRNAGALVSGSVAVTDATANTEIKFTISGLDPNIHSYTMYYVGKDTAGNYSERIGYITIQTLDTDAPTVTLEFTDAEKNNNGTWPNPQPGSDIKLIFSEQVKGGETATKTFLDYYNDVKNAATTELQEAAKDALAKVLGDHIELHYKPRTMTSRDGITLSNTQGEDYGWINWREAVVTMGADGTVTVTLSNSAGAVQLGSGMDYFFRFIDVYDDAFHPNRLMNTTNNYYDMDLFTTVYGQVWLLPNNNTNTKNVVSDDPDLNGIRLDVRIDVTPKSTGTIPDSEFWDMIIWSTAPVNFIVYRSVDGRQWEQVTGEISLGPPNKSADALNQNKTSSYIAANAWLGVERLERVKDGLAQGSTYTYGIHFTSVDGVPEENSTAQPQSWSKKFTMRFSVVAGDFDLLNNNLKGTNIAGYYERALNDPNFHVIGVTNSGESILECEVSFSDTRVPSFQPNYPQIQEASITSGSFTMRLVLEREATVYYVVAPMNRDGEKDNAIINTYIEEQSGRTTLTTDNDGSQYSGSVDDKGAWLRDNYAYYEPPTGENRVLKYKTKTYIPLNGTERNDYKDYIYFMTGETVPSIGSGGSSGAPGKYKGFTNIDIFNGESRYANDEEVRAGKLTYTGSIVTKNIEGLSADTWYYVYMVVQGGTDGLGTLDEIVQIYRVKTKEASPPAIRISHSTTAAAEAYETWVSMDIYDAESTDNTLYNNPEVYYAMVRKDDMPQLLSEPFPDGPKEMTVLEALINKVGLTNKSVFDVYASDELREQLVGYITMATTYDQVNSSTKLFGPFNENQLSQNCTPNLSQEGEYILLACARHEEKDVADYTAYGFAATQGLYKPDPVPPEFKSFNGNPLGGEAEIWVDAVTAGGFTEIVTVEGGYNWANERWNTYPEKMNSYLFTGTLTLTFDKKIYVYDNDALKQVVNKLPWTWSGKPDTDARKANYADPDTEKSILEVIGSSTAFTVDKVGQGNGTTFYLKFTGQRNISLTMQNLYNGGGVVKSNKMLSITFNKTITLGQYWKHEGYDEDIYGSGNTNIGNTLNPVFIVKWQ